MSHSSVKVAILDDYQNVALTNTDKWLTATVTSASGNVPLSSLLTHSMKRSKTKMPL